MQRHYGPEALAVTEKKQISDAGEGTAPLIIMEPKA